MSIHEIEQIFMFNGSLISSSANYSYVSFIQFLDFLDRFFFLLIGRHSLYILDINYLSRMCCKCFLSQWLIFKLCLWYLLSGRSFKFRCSQISLCSEAPSSPSPLCLILYCYHLESLTFSFCTGTHKLCRCSYLYVILGLGL